MPRPQTAAGDDSLKLLILIDSLGLGGAESLLVPFVRAARRSNISVQIASLEGRHAPRTQMVEAIRSEGIEPHFLGIDRLLTPTGIPRLARYIRVSGYDVVHAHLGYSITLGVPAARLAGRPAVGTFHHIPFDMSRRETIKERLSVEAASRGAQCIFVSDAQRKAFAARYPQHTERWAVIRNGVDLDEFQEPGTCWPEDLGIPQGAPVVTIAAALRHAKGHHTAIAAWEIVQSKVPEARLLIVGSGPEEQALRQQAARAGLDHRVVFAGFRRDVASLLRESTLMVSASQTEALPTVLMEAAAASLPVIATSVGGTTELVEDGVTGILVPPDQPDVLSRAIVELLNDPQSRARMAVAAHARALTDFGSNVWIARLRQVYEQARIRGRLRQDQT